MKAEFGATVVTAGAGFWREAGVALDVVILGAEDRWEEFFGIEAEEHWLLMQAARSQNCGMVLRMSDYYEETAFAVGDIPDLVRELDSLRALVPSNVVVIIDTLVAMAQKAAAAGKGLEVLPD